MQWPKKERGGFQAEDPRKQLRPHEAAITTDEPSQRETEIAITTDKPNLGETSQGAPNALPGKCAVNSLKLTA